MAPEAAQKNATTYSMIHGTEDALAYLHGEQIFDLDTYDACYVCILRLFSRTSSKTFAILSFTITFLLHVFSIFLQVGSLFLLIAFGVEHNQDPYEKLDIDADVLSLTHAADNNITLDATSHFVELCLGDHSVPYTAAIFTWLWSIKLLPSLQSTITSVLVTIALQRSSEVGELIPEPKSGKQAIVSATLCAKFIAMVVVSIPRVMVTLYMWWAGAKLLACSNSLLFLITKCVSLAFILQIPEFIFKALVNHILAADVKKTVLRYKQGRLLTDAFLRFTAKIESYADGHSSAEEIEELYEGYTHWKVWGQPLFLLTATGLLTVGVRELWFKDIITFQSACYLYKSKVLAPQCLNEECGFRFFGIVLYS